jgi:hypothetical protein
MVLLFVDDNVAVEIRFDEFAVVFRDHGESA